MFDNKDVAMTAVIGIFLTVFFFGVGKMNLTTQVNKLEEYKVCLASHEKITFDLNCGREK